MAQDHTPQPKPNRNWIWYFIGIGLVAVVLLGWLALFIHQQLEPGQQLKKEQLATARKLWEAKNIADYQLFYTVQRGGAGKDQFFVEVKGGKVQSVTMNGKTALPKEQLEYHSMTALFNDIEIFLHRDAQPGSPGTFCRAWFDSEDGHLMLFVRRVIGGPERVEIKVEEFRPKP